LIDGTNDPIIVDERTVEGAVEGATAGVIKGGRINRIY